MRESNDSQLSPQNLPRRFVYRAAEAEGFSHPLRRSTDTPQAFRGIAGEICPRVVQMKFRVYLKVN
jgi:hypothetical protein